MTSAHPRQRLAGRGQVCLAEQATPVGTHVPRQMQAVLTARCVRPGPAEPARHHQRHRRLLRTGHAGDASQLGAVAAAWRNLGDVSLRYRTLLSRLGPGVDSPGTLTEADAWYCILESSREQSVAEAQAMAITELVAHAATTPQGEPRAILLACDDYSAVSGRVPLWQLYERGRSLGVGVQVSASPGKDSARTTTNDAGSAPPPMAASG
jgi:hypothetical protein